MSESQNQFQNEIEVHHDSIDAPIMMKNAANESKNSHSPHLIPIEDQLRNQMGEKDSDTQDMEKNFQREVYKENSIDKQTLTGNMSDQNQVNEDYQQHQIQSAENIDSPFSSACSVEAPSLSEESLNESSSQNEHPEGNILTETKVEQDNIQSSSMANYLYLSYVNKIARNENNSPASILTNDSANIHAFHHVDQKQQNDLHQQPSISIGSEQNSSGQHSQSSGSQNQSSQNLSQRREALEGESKVLLVIVQNPKDEVIEHKVIFGKFCHFGVVEQILIFSKKQQWKFFVDMDSLQSAIRAKQYLDNSLLHVNECELKMRVQYSNQQELHLKNGNPGGINYKELNQKFENTQLSYSHPAEKASPMFFPTTKQAPIFEIPVIQNNEQNHQKYLFNSSQNILPRNPTYSLSLQLIPNVQLQPIQLQQQQQQKPSVYKINQFKSTNLRHEETPKFVNAPQVPTFDYLQPSKNSLSSHSDEIMYTIQRPETNQSGVIGPQKKIFNTRESLTEQDNLEELLNHINKQPQESSQKSGGDDDNSNEDNEFRFDSDDHEDSISLEQKKINNVDSNEVNDRVKYEAYREDDTFSLKDMYSSLNVAANKTFPFSSEIRETNQQDKWQQSGPFNYTTQPPPVGGMEKLDAILAKRKGTELSNDQHLAVSDDDDDQLDNVWPFKSESLIHQLTQGGTNGNNQTEEQNQIQISTHQQRPYGSQNVILSQTPSTPPGIFLPRSYSPQHMQTGQDIRPVSQQQQKIAGQIQTNGQINNQNLSKSANLLSQNTQGSLSSSHFVSNFIGNQNGGSIYNTPINLMMLNQQSIPYSLTNTQQTLSQPHNTTTGPYQVFHPQNQQQQAIANQTFAQNQISSPQRYLQQQQMAQQKGYSHTNNSSIFAQQKQPSNQFNSNQMNIQQGVSSSAFGQQLNSSPQFGMQQMNPPSYSNTPQQFSQQILHPSSYCQQMTTPALYSQQMNTYGQYMNSPGAYSQQMNQQSVYGQQMSSPLTYSQQTYNQQMNSNSQLKGNSISYGQGFKSTSGHVTCNSSVNGMVNTSEGEESTSENLMGSSNPNTMSVANGNETGSGQLIQENMGKFNGQTYVKQGFLEDSRPSRVIYVNHLQNPDITICHLYNVFSNFGDIVKMLLKRQKGTAFIEYTTQEYATRAKDCMDKKIFFEFEVRVFYSHFESLLNQEDKQAECFIGTDQTHRFLKEAKMTLNSPSLVIHISNLKQEMCDHEKMHELFHPFGKIDAIHIEKLPPKYMCHIKFSLLKESLLAVAYMHNKEIKGRKMYISFTRKKLDQSNTKNLVFYSKSPDPFPL